METKFQTGKLPFNYKHLPFDSCHLLLISLTVNAANGWSLHTQVNTTKVLSSPINSLVPIYHGYKSYQWFIPKEEQVLPGYFLWLMLFSHYSTRKQHKLARVTLTVNANIAEVLTWWRRTRVPTESCHGLLSLLNWCHAYRISRINQPQWCR